MGKWSNLTDAVAAVIRANGNREITGQVLQNALLNIISNLGNFASFAGMATPSTNPGTPDGPVYYFATQAGTYTNFGALVLDGSCYVLYWNGTAWSSTKIDLPTTAEVTSAMNSLIATESAARQQADGTLGAAITAEVSRATAAEAALSAKTSQISNAQTGEEGEAIVFEDDNGGTVAEVNNDGVKAKSFMTLDGRSLDTDIQNNATAIVNETERATAAETSLSTDISAVENLVESKVSDITNLQNKTDGISSDVIEDDDDFIAIADDEGNVIVSIDSEDLTVKGVKFSDKQNKLADVHEAKTPDSSDEIVFIDDNNNEVAKIGDYGIKAKSFQPLEGVPSFDLFPPKAIFEAINTTSLKNSYGEKNEVQSRDYINRIYAERFYLNSDALIYGRLISKCIGNETRWKYTLNNVTEQSIQIPFKNDFETENASFKLISVKNEIAVDKLITVMCLGDSITAGDLAFYDGGSYQASWAFWNYAHSLFIMDNIDWKENKNLLDDKIKFIPIGTKGESEPYVTNYKGQSVTQSDDYCEGRSGWTLFSYLRHPLNISQISEGHYDILGLKTANGAWNGTQAHKSLVANTCWGKYQPDITKASWETYRSKISLQSVEFENATAEQKEALSNWATNTIVSNPENPFFSTTISTYNGREYCFSWPAYFARYKTHENDGVTELVTKGTKATTNMKVCVPKFIVINLGTNDSSNEQANIYLDIELVANVLKSATSAKIILWCNANTNATNVKYFANTTQISNSVPTVMFNRNKFLMDFCGTLVQQKTNGIYYMPSYFVQGYGQAAEHRIESEATDTEYDYRFASGDVHPGAEANRQIGFQLYSFLLWLLSDE